MKTADPELMRAINRFHVMDAIRRFGPLSRVEICALTELSPTTVSAITAALLDDSLIISEHIGAVRDAARGRPRVMLRLNPGAAHVVGVKLACDQISVAVTNFCGDILHALSLPIRVDRQKASVILDLVEDGVRRCLSDAGLELSEISGVCVGLPGVIERATGVCRQSPVLRERDAALGPELAQRLAVPTSIDSDVNLAALAEHWFGQARGLSDFLVVNVERSLGLAISAQRRAVSRRQRPQPRSRRLHAARAERRRRAAGGGRDRDRRAQRRRFLRGRSAHAAGAGDGGACCSRADAGDADCARALAKAGEALGFAIANLITLFAPPKVFVSGRAMAASPHFVAPLRASVAALLPPSLADVSRNRLVRVER